MSTAHLGNTNDEEIIQLEPHSDDAITGMYRTLCNVESLKHMILSHVHRFFMETQDRKFHMKRTRQARNASVEFWDYLKNFVDEKTSPTWRSVLRDFSLLNPDLLTDLYVKLNKELWSEVQAEGKNQD
jgi:hypothetical protein